MNPYKRLLGNTAIFAIGTFSSKLLVFLMMRFYTAYLAPSEMSDADLIVQLANVIIPIASVSISNAVIRFGLERANDKRQVFTIGIFTVLIGWAITLPFYPLLTGLEWMHGAPWIVYLYVLISSLQAVCQQFVRALDHIKLYTFNGIYRTVVTVAANILLLKYLHWGVLGYVSATIIADASAIIMLSAVDRLPRYLTLRRPDKRLVQDMLRYAIPLIPTQICVWVFSMSDRYFVRYLCGSHANGLYSVAYRIPTVLILISSLFIEAWQISTVTDCTREEQSSFFSKVGNVYQALIFTLSSGIILCSKLAMFLFADPAYYDGWRYIPLLIFGSGFACLSNFVNSIYTLHKKTVFSLCSALLGAGMNIVLNALLIPPFGPNGAAFATLLSYIVMFLVRSVHSRQFIRVHWKVPRFVTSFALLCLQSALMLHEGHLWLVWQILLCAFIAWLNCGDILLGLQRVLSRRRAGR